MALGHSGSQLNTHGFLFFSKPQDAWDSLFTNWLALLPRWLSKCGHSLWVVSVGQLDVIYSVKKTPSLLLVDSPLEDAWGRRPGERGGLACRCLYWACAGLLARQLLPLPGLWWTLSGRPPGQRPVSYLLVAMWPVHLGCLRMARCLEGVWREKHLSPGLFPLTLNYW